MNRGYPKYLQMVKKGNCRRAGAWTFRAMGGILLGGMNKLIIAAFIGLSCVVVSSAQQAPAPNRPAAPPAAPKTPAATTPTVAPAVAHPTTELTATAVHDLFTRYCVG